MAHISIADPAAGTAGATAPAAVSPIACLTCERAVRRGTVRPRRPAPARPVVARPPAVPSGRPGRRALRPDRPDLRLTRRGRVVVVTLAALVLCAALSVARVTSEASTTPVPPRQVYVVRPGDTMWSIAARIAPGVDPRVTVSELLGINGLPNADLIPGQPLRLP